MDDNQTKTQAIAGAGAYQAGFWGASAVAAKTLSPLALAPFPGARVLYGVGVFGAGLLGAMGLTAVTDELTGVNKSKDSTGHKEGDKVGALTVDKVDDEGRVESVERPGGLKLNERPSIQELIKKENESKLNDSNLIGHSAMYDKPAEVEFIPFPVSSGGSASGESGSSGGFSLDLGSDVYDVAALNREASNLAKVWA